MRIFGYVYFASVFSAANFFIRPILKSFGCFVLFGIYLNEIKTDQINFRTCISTAYPYLNFGSSHEKWCVFTATLSELVHTHTHFSPMKLIGCFRTRVRYPRPALRNGTYKLQFSDRRENHPTSEPSHAPLPFSPEASRVWIECIDLQYCRNDEGAFGKWTMCLWEKSRFLNLDLEVWFTLWYHWGLRIFWFHLGIIYW